MPVAIVSRQWGRDGTSRSQGQSKEQYQGLEPWWSLFLELQDLAGIFLNSNKEAYVMAELSELWVGESCLLRGRYRWRAGSWLWRVGVLELQKNQGCPLLCFVGRPMTSGGIQAPDAEPLRQDGTCQWLWKQLVLLHVCSLERVDAFKVGTVEFSCL